MVEPDAAPADGDERTPATPGGAGAPPAGTKTRCQELADGGPPRLAARRKARPGVEQMPHWSAARRASERTLTPQGVH